MRTFVAIALGVLVLGLIALGDSVPFGPRLTWSRTAVLVATIVALAFALRFVMP